MQQFASLVLRAGLAVVFLYAAIASILDPISWIGFLPQWLQMIVPGSILLFVFSVYEVILSLWLLSGWRSLTAGLFAAGTLFLIIIQNLGALDIVFRDVAILFAATALIILSWPKK